MTDRDDDLRIPQHSTIKRAIPNGAMDKLTGIPWNLEIDQQIIQNLPDPSAAVFHINPENMNSSFDSTSSTATSSNAEEPTAQFPTSNADDPHHLMDSEQSSPTARQRSIRFKPRVRISSGVRRQSKSFTALPAEPIDILPDGYFGRHHHHHAPSSSSSLSTSPSSSISVPLRTQEDETEERAAFTAYESSDSPRTRRWGPLGQRINILARNRETRLRAQMAENDSAQASTRNSSNERATLLRRQFNARGNRSRYDSYGSFDDSTDEEVDEQEERDLDEERLLGLEIDRLFGTWPGRLLNQHWWWWQLEPVMCWHCFDGEDDDQYDRPEEDEENIRPLS